MKAKKLVEGDDFFWSTIDGYKFKVFTEKYLLKRGFCCGNKCTNCPYRKGNEKNNKS